MSAPRTNEHRRPPPFPTNINSFPTDCDCGLSLPLSKKDEADIID